MDGTARRDGSTRSSGWREVVLLLLRVMRRRVGGVLVVRRRSRLKGVVRRAGRRSSSFRTVRRNAMSCRRRRVLLLLRRRWRRRWRVRYRVGTDVVRRVRHKGRLGVGRGRVRRRRLSSIGGAASALATMRTGGGLDGGGAQGRELASCSGGEMRVDGGTDEHAGNLDRRAAEGREGVVSGREVVRVRTVR